MTIFSSKVKYEKKWNKKKIYISSSCESMPSKGDFTLGGM